LPQGVGFEALAACLRFGPVKPEEYELVVPKERVRISNKALDENVGHGKENVKEEFADEDTETDAKGCPATSNNLHPFCIRFG
jgi:molybdate-binding protein